MKYKNTSTLARKYLGSFYGELGEHEKSIFYFDSCIDEMWSEPDFMVNYACNLYDLGLKEEALEIFVSAKIIHPEFNHISKYIDIIQGELKIEK